MSRSPGARHYLNHLPVIHEAITGGESRSPADGGTPSEFEGTGGMLFQFEADPPTVTMQVQRSPRLRAEVYQVIFCCHTSRFALCQAAFLCWNCKGSVQGSCRACCCADLIPTPVPTSFDIHDRPRPGPPQCPFMAASCNGLVCVVVFLVFVHPTRRCMF